MQLYFRYIQLLFRSQLQYKASFAMTVFTQFLTPFASLAGIYLLFERFGNIDGWTAYEVFLCFAVIGISFSVSTCFARGFDKFAGVIRNGDFDRVLVRPRSTLLQVLGSELDMKRAGHLLQSILVLSAAVIKIELQWDALKILTLFHMIVGGTCIFFGVYLLQATLAFFTTEGLEITNILTHGVKEHASYPLDILPCWIIRFFTFVIPFACVNFLPMRALLGQIKGSELLYMLLPLTGIVFIAPCLFVWRFGVRHYRSTGS